MSGAPACGKNLWVNAFSVVGDSQPKVPVAIPDRHFDQRCLRVAARIAHGFATNAVDFIAYNGCKFTRGPFLIDAQFRA